MEFVELKDYVPLEMFTKLVITRSASFAQYLPTSVLQHSVPHKLCKSSYGFAPPPVSVGKGIATISDFSLSPKLLQSPAVTGQMSCISTEQATEWISTYFDFLHNLLHQLGISAGLKLEKEDGYGSMVVANTSIADYNITTMKDEVLLAFYIRNSVVKLIRGPAIPMELAAPLAILYCDDLKCCEWLTRNSDRPMVVTSKKSKDYENTPVRIECQKASGKLQVKANDGGWSQVQYPKSAAGFEKLIDNLTSGLKSAKN